MTMTKKIGQFLRHRLINGRIILWFNIGPLSFPNEYSSCRWTGKNVFVVLLYPLIGSQKQLHWFSPQNFRTASRRFPACCCRFPCCSSSPRLTYSSHEKFWPTSENCPTSTFVKNPASAQKFNHTILLWQPFNSFLVSLQWIFFLRRIIGQSCVCLHHTWHKQWVWLSYHYRSPCSYMAGFVFFTQIWDCSVNTELIKRDNCAKNNFNRSIISAKVCW